ncbi:TraX family protein [Paenibacillus hodogayensis]|uniref:TraX family protein n=1 Tax=Paenibacillus hodogayensis TaxID=279208 RepID=A0ABV5W2G7_9BACL
MHLIAMLTMVIDHAGHIFAPGQSIWRIVGRLAMPIYAYCLVEGYRHTGSLMRYIRRLVLLAAISQVPYLAALDMGNINIIGTFVVCLLVMAAMDRIKPKAGAWAVALAGVAVLELIPFDYGAYALLLVLAFRYLESHRLVMAHLALNAAYLLYRGADLQLYSVVSTMFLVYRPSLYRLLDRIEIKRWVWRSFYPAHLVVLAAAEQVIDIALRR